MRSRARPGAGVRRSGSRSGMRRPGGPTWPCRSSIIAVDRLRAAAVLLRVRCRRCSTSCPCRWPRSPSSSSSLARRVRAAVRHDPRRQADGRDRRSPAASRWARPRRWSGPAWPARRPALLVRVLPDARTVHAAANDTAGGRAAARRVDPAGGRRAAAGTGRDRSRRDDARRPASADRRSRDSSAVVTPGRVSCLNWSPCHTARTLRHAGRGVALRGVGVRPCHRPAAPSPCG